MNYFICTIIGYLLGCINAAYLVGRRKGFDIRERGSNNPGASNVTITMGVKAGAVVALWDIAKAIIAVLIVKNLFRDMEYAAAIAGVACVIGHMFPIFLSFKGGKGFASFLGMMLILNWRAFLVLIALAIIITFVTDYIAIATLATAISYPIYIVLSSGEWVVSLIISVASFAMVCKHIVNIKKIISGNEIGLSSLWRKTV